VWKVATIPPAEYVKLFFFKGLYLFNMVILPKWLLDISWPTILGAFLVMLFTASTFSLLVLLSPHANTESQYPLPDAYNEFEHTWFMHQLLCANDIREDNWFIRYCMGSFNYHLIHHLLPTLSHVHYPRVTQELRRLTAEYNLPYRVFPLFTCLRNHYRLLKQNGSPGNLFEETM
jgi:linoleoyl-CoA desaturase